MIASLHVSVERLIEILLQQICLSREAICRISRLHKNWPVLNKQFRIKYHTQIIFQRDFEGVIHQITKLNVNSR